MHNEWLAHRSGRVLAPLAVFLGLAATAQAITFTINTIGGPIEVDVTHAGPSGGLVSPRTPESTTFKPPSIFSAPLPSGSGARALGLAGAFTAVADDATASSWNPGGLIQLERPEASLVLRLTRERDTHRSEDESFQTGDDRFGNEHINYFSAVYPFRFLNHNWVFAVNYQEAYDFTQEFHADLHSTSSDTYSERSSRTYTETTVQHITEGPVEMDVTTHVTTLRDSFLRQLLSSDLAGKLEFEQEGIIDAVTPALCFEVTPKLSLGAALNLYRLGPDGDGVIRSRSRANYSGTTESLVDLRERSSSTGTYSFNGTVTYPGPFPPIPINGSGDIPPFEETSSSSSRDATWTEGVVEECNEFHDLEGLNATFGVLWTVSRHLRLGASLDLPWTADAEQKQTTRNTAKTYNESKTRVLSTTDDSNTSTKDVEIDFPLYCAVGAVWHWNNRFFTALDVSHTLWSDFAYQAEGEDKINPLDGSAYGENEIEDCWAVKMGMEYLWVLEHTEIPFRCGVGWEERPAVGDPDPYWSASAGTGISIGKDPGKLILDIAYVYTWGDDVLGSLVPDQDELETDVEKHEVYVSGIWHF